MTPDVTSRLRMWGYCLVLVALAFVQQPGQVVGDTKFDLVVDPLGFLRRAGELWDPGQAFGQIQNQAYGYFWPMGPFFVLGHVLGLPGWVVQRLWWAALLCLAFVGTVKVARALGMGRPWAQVVSGFAFALSAHVLTLLGPTSVEAWPSAWAPWVLLPLIQASKQGSVRRGAALSALAVAMCGGVNATAVSAVLPLGAIWLATRERGRLRLRLFSWWVGFTLLATLWWVVPLLLLGRYSVPFLDYIENAPITTLTTGLPDVLGGTSDWVAYISPADWGAGHLLSTTPFLLVNAAVIAGAGLAGIASRDNPERQFLFLGVLAGLVLVGFGYTGPLHGWWAQERLALLDAELAPFRNLHKYDVVLRLCLVLGLSHFLTVMAASARTASLKVPQRVAVMVTIVSVVGMAAPAYAGRLAPPGSFDAVPQYWRNAARYLAAAPAGVALEVPASAFGDYLWGSPHDDVLQPLAASPWAVRNIIPLAQPGNVRFLDAVTDVLEGGRPSPVLSSVVAAHGVRYLVVRNDLAPTRTGAPDPVVLHQALDLSPGLTKVAQFGPAVGVDPVFYRHGVRVVSNRGRQAAYPALEVYAVRGATGRVSAWRASSVPIVAGDPAAGLTYDAKVLSGPTVLVGDRSKAFLASPTVLTDGLRRRETAFTAVRDNESSTLTRREPWTLRSVVHNHEIYRRQGRFETLARWAGVASVSASSAQSEAAALPPLRRDRSPAEAVDGAPWSEWVSSDVHGAVGQWWRVDFERPTYLRTVKIRLGEAASPPVTRLRITTGVGSRVVHAPPAGVVGAFSLPAGPSKFLEVRAAQVDGGGGGTRFAIAEVRLPGVEAKRFLAPPDVFAHAPDHILLRREEGRPACAVVGGSTTCDDLWDRSGEQELTIRRMVTLPEDGAYEVALTASPRRGPDAVRRVSRALPVQVQTSPPLSLAMRASGLTVLDGDPGTAWTAAPTAGPPPFMTLRWDKPAALERIAFDLSPRLAGALPRKVVLRAGNTSRTVTLENGRGTFKRLVTNQVRIEFMSTEPAYSFEQGQEVALPVAVGEVRFPGADVPTVDPNQPLDLPCGTGPTLTVDGSNTLSRLDADLSTMLSGARVPAIPCGDGRVTLRAGTSTVELSRSQVVGPEELDLTAAGVPASSPTRLRATADRWTATSRTVSLPRRQAPTLLLVNENINRGWVAELSGRSLAPQRVDGWMQGWVVPAGPPGKVVLHFAPAPAYRSALLTGLLSLLVVTAAAALPDGRRRGGASTGDASWAVIVSCLLAGGLLAGWAGFAAMCCAVLLGGGHAAGRWLPYAAGVGVALAGVAQAADRAEEFAVASRNAQSLAILGLVLAAGAFGANGPEFFKRRKGRSRK